MTKKVLKKQNFCLTFICLCDIILTVIIYITINFVLNGGCYERK